MLIIYPFPALAQFQYQLTPAISVSEVYDDNINLDESNEVDDYITTVSPSIAFDVLTEHTNLALRYAPTFVFYDEFDQNDTTRHLGTITWSQQLGQYLSLNLTDTYYRSEEPIEYDVQVQGVRTTRNTYWRNSGNVSLGFKFGPENTVTLGYGQSYLKNDDPTLDDGRIQTPSANLSYWFNVRNGVDLHYQYTKADFWRDVGTAGDDYDGNAAGLRFTHRFTPHTSGSIGYDFTTRDFDGLTEDYDIHQGSAGFNHAFSPDLSISLSGGYFVQDLERSDDESGGTYDALLSKGFEHGNISIGGNGGWYESYLDAERRGFTRYYSGNVRLEYQVAEKVSFYAGGSYRRDRRDLDKREWDTWRGDAGISLTLLRYFALSLDYRYAQRDDDLDTEDYKSNRVMLTLTGSKLYRW